MLCAIAERGTAVCGYELLIAVFQRAPYSSQLGMRTALPSPEDVWTGPGTRECWDGATAENVTQCCFSNIAVLSGWSATLCFDESYTYMRCCVGRPDRAVSGHDKVQTTTI